MFTYAYATRSGLIIVIIFLDHVAIARSICHLYLTYWALTTRF